MPATFYYCANNTIYGTEWGYVPDTGDVPLVCDMSSDILSRPVDVSKFGIIYAGARRTWPPPALTVVIIREDLAGHELPYTPVMMSYKAMIDKDSMYNTPPCWCIYMLGLTLDWVEEQGGLAGMEKLRTLRSSMLYDTLDSSRLFHCHAEKFPLRMNVTFRTGDEALDANSSVSSGKIYWSVLNREAAGGLSGRVRCRSSLTSPMRSKPHLRHGRRADGCGHLRDRRHGGRHREPALSGGHPAGGGGEGQGGPRGGGAAGPV